MENRKSNNEKNLKQCSLTAFGKEEEKSEKRAKNEGFKEHDNTRGRFPVLARNVSKNYEEHIEKSFFLSPSFRGFPVK